MGCMVVLYLFHPTVCRSCLSELFLPPPHLSQAGQGGMIQSVYKYKMCVRLLLFIVHL